MFGDSGILKDVSGNKIKRPGNSSVNCEFCPKWISDNDNDNDKKKGTRFKGFSSAERYFFTCFRVAKSIGALPRTGGIDNQDPYTLEILLLLLEIAESKDIMSDRQFSIDMAKAARGLL